MIKRMAFVMLVTIISLSTNIFCQKPIGIENCGNSCYFNALVQVLQAMPQLNNFLGRYIHCYKPDSLTAQYNELNYLINIIQLDETLKNDSTTFIAKENGSLRDFFYYIGKTLSGRIQQAEDTQQLLQLLLDDIYDVGLLTDADYSQERKEIKNIIFNTIGCKLKNTLMLLDDSKERELSKIEKNFMISTEIPIFQQKAPLELKDCLDTFFAPEIIAKESTERIMWPKTGTYEDIVKHTVLENTPQLLTIHLKRFNWDLLEQKAEKIQDPILIPINNFDIKSYLDTNLDAHVSTIYDLKAVVVHTGNGDGGHYLSYIKNDSKWYRCDDSLITEISSEEIQKLETHGYLQSHNTPYILFYERTI